MKALTFVIVLNLGLIVAITGAETNSTTSLKDNNNTDLTSAGSSQFNYYENNGSLTKPKPKGISWAAGAFDIGLSVLGGLIFFAAVFWLIGLSGITSFRLCSLLNNCKGGAKAIEHYPAGNLQDPQLQQDSGLGGFESYPQDQYEQSQDSTNLLSKRSVRMVAPLLENLAKLYGQQLRKEE